MSKTWDDLKSCVSIWEMAGNTGKSRDMAILSFEKRIFLTAILSMRIIVYTIFDNRRMERGKPPKTLDFQRFFNRNENEHRYQHILTSGTLCVNRQSVITQRYSVIFLHKNKRRNPVNTSVTRFSQSVTKRKNSIQKL